MEVPGGFEPPNNGFADRPLGPLGHGTNQTDYSPDADGEFESELKRPESFVPPSILSSWRAQSSNTTRTLVGP